MGFVGARLIRSNVLPTSFQPMWVGLSAGCYENGEDLIKITCYHGILVTLDDLSLGIIGYSAHHPSH
ncbi:MAG: hypothetical protein CM1200mP22_25410 [Dehalococcoidia bacterium]|nr:MAG: hypothetical protein CM1200mP22_25410 [Dehalococcoidia bacterium]